MTKRSTHDKVEPLMRDAACYSQRLDEAIALATEAFRYRRRKGTRIPYLSHLLQVMVTVAEHGGDEDQLIAALLHDYIEDIEGASLTDLAHRFGTVVSGMVGALSDATTRPKPPWEQRKRAYLAKLRSMPASVKLVSAADKLHNARSIHRDFLAVGDAVWDRFKASRDQTLWYYREVVQALSSGWTGPLLDELRAEVVSLHGAVGVDCGDL